LSAETAWKAEACASVSVRLGARKISPTRKSSNVRAGTTVKLLGSNVRAVTGMSVVEVMLSSLPSWFFERWSVVKSSVDAKLLFGKAYGCYTCCTAKNHMAAEQTVRSLIGVRGLHPSN
jgi:hypothetical protein